MPLKIAPSAYHRIDSRLMSHLEGADAQRQARDLLHKMAVDMVGSSGQIKKGYLKLTLTDGDALRLGTRWSKSADGSTRDAVHLVRSLVSQGFGGSEVNAPAVRQALDNYLNAKRGDHLGTHSFVKLVRELESAAGLPRDPKDRLELARVKVDATLDSREFALDFSSFKHDFEQAESQQARGQVIQDLCTTVLQRSEDAYLDAVAELSDLPEEVAALQREALSANRHFAKVEQAYPLISLNCLREDRKELIEGLRDLDLQEFANAKAEEQAAIQHLGISAEEYLSIRKSSFAPGESARTVFGITFFEEQGLARHPISAQLRSNLILAFDEASTLDGFYAEAQKLIHAAKESVKQLDNNAQPAPAEQARHSAAGGLGKAELLNQAQVAEGLQQVESDLIPGGMELAHDADIPPLVEARPMEGLTKAKEFALDFPAALTAKKFNALTGDLAELGRAIDNRLLERGLKAPRGLSRIELNGEKVYCYFDSAGKAKAILPKGQSIDHDQKFNVPTFALDQPSIDYLKRFGTPQKMREWIDKLEDGERPKWDLRREIIAALTQSWTQDPSILQSTKDAFTEQGHAIFQLVIAGQPWVAEVSKVPGKGVPPWIDSREMIAERFKEERWSPSELESEYVSNVKDAIDLWIDNASVRVFPATQRLPEDAHTSTSELARTVPWGRFEKNTRVKLARDYDQVLTKFDGAYSKKFYQVAQSKAEFFEHLLQHEPSHPGIANRMLVGVPTADKKKAISPLGATQMLGDSVPYAFKSPILSDKNYVSKFETAATQAIDDLAVVCQGGFDVPERKGDHFLMNPDPSLEKLEISMIDFGTGRNQSAASKRDAFLRGTSFLVTNVAAFIDQNNLSEVDGWKGLVPALNQKVEEKLARIT